MKRKTKPRYWKVLDANGRSCHGGTFQWSLPTWDDRKGWIPGDWTPAIPDVKPCVRGYHVCRDSDLVQWLHERIYACEVRGVVVEASNKVVVQQVRLTCPTPWDEVSARLFAVECAAGCLSLYEKEYPNDPRVFDCIEASLRLALADASEKDAARSVARSAAERADRSAARSATRSAVWSAAWSAARSAADAARSAAWSAAEIAAVRATDAARSAAGNAVWSAAGSAAGNAAWSAAGDAAERDAGRAAGRAADAAGSAARSAQTQRVLWWMGADL